MKQIIIEGKVCVGPTFSRGEFALIKRNLAEQKGLVTLANVLDAAGNLQRLKILYLLYAHKELCVCDLAEILDLTDSAASQHLRKLKDQSIVKTRRSGQTIYYSLVYNVFTNQIGELFHKEETRQQYAFIMEERAEQ